MTGAITSELAEESLELVARFKDQGYGTDLVNRRRKWIEQKTHCLLDQVGAFSIPSEQMRGNVENPIGVAQVPLGVAGPLLINGSQAQGTFYVPLATTEGVLLRSYERGMVKLTRAGGVSTSLYTDENRIAPVFVCDDVTEALAFAQSLDENFDLIRAEADSTTNHGKLLRIELHPVGREV